MNSLTLIREFLESRAGISPDKVVPEAALTDLGVDSLTQLELMFEFEERFDMTLSRDLKVPGTVGEMAALMDGLRDGTA